MLKTYIDTINDYQGKEFVVFLGMPQKNFDLPRDKCVILSNLCENKLTAVYELSPQLFKNGLSIVINKKEYFRFKDEFQQAQKHLAFLYCKFISYPRESFKIGDPFNVRNENCIEILHETNTLKSLPLLLHYPMLDKLALVRLKQPVLILLPGPSLQDIGSALPELARKCLVVCLSRTIDFCLDRGVEPDFIIQLDTYQRQRHFYPTGRQFKNSYLVAIPVSPIHAFAKQFRGLFFMQSFNIRVLPNHYFLRRSCLSSLLPCLGFAEALCAPQVFLAGADLSFSSSGKQYFNQADSDHHQSRSESLENWPADAPLIIKEGAFPIPDADGMTVMTTLAYFATAVEAEYFAQDIHKTTGTKFFNLTHAGILSRRYFFHADIEQIMKLNDINRDAVRQEADSAMNKTEKIDYPALKEEMSKTIGELESHTLFLQNCLSTHNYNEARKHPFFKVADYFKECSSDFSVEEKLRLAVNFGNEWIEKAKQAGKLAQLHHLRESGRSLLIVSLPKEREELASELEYRYPQWNRIIRCIWNQTFPSPQDDNFNWIMLDDLLEWLKQKKLVVISDSLRKEYDYIFDLLPLDNVIFLGDTMLMELPPKKGEQNPVNEDPYLRLGFYYLKRGNEIKAKQYFCRALETDPENQNAASALKSIVTADFGK